MFPHIGKLSCMTRLRYLFEECGGLLIMMYHYRPRKLSRKCYSWSMQSYLLKSKRRKMKTKSSKSTALLHPLLGHLERALGGPNYIIVRLFSLFPVFVILALSAHLLLSDGIKICKQIILDPQKRPPIVSLALLQHSHTARKIGKKFQGGRVLN